MERGITDIRKGRHAWKGNNFQKLVYYIVSDIIETKLPLKVIEGKQLENPQTDPKLDKVKRNLLVDFGELGCYLPDADIVVYDPNDLSVKAIISCKVSLQEGISQTAYWKMKLSESPITQHIKMFFVAIDSDRNFFSLITSKSAAIAMDHFDAFIVLRNAEQERHDVHALAEIVDKLGK